jgi:hypothetical protein
MAEDLRAEARPHPDEVIERRDTGLRILLTLLFLLIATVIESVLALIVIFELLWALVTKEVASPRVRDLANRMIAYYYRVGRYLTYNESQVPFPFSDFPGPVEPGGWRGGSPEADALGLANLEDSRRPGV